jgi:hypothetical protein
MKIEYLKDSVDEPVYITLGGFGLGKKRTERVAGYGTTGILSKKLVKKLMVPAMNTPVFAEVFAELKLPREAMSTTDTHTAEVAAQQKRKLGNETPDEQVQIEYSPGFGGFLERLGFKHAKITGPDFRRKAAHVSEQARKGRSIMEMARTNLSFCLAVDETQRLEPEAISRLHKHIIYWILGLVISGFIFLTLSLTQSTNGGKDLTGFGKILAVLGVLFIVATTILAMCAPFLKNHLIKMRIQNRPESVISTGSGRIIKMYLEDSKTYHVGKRAPEDFCLCLLDKGRRCILMEGATHRYVIHAEDVSKLEPLESGNKVSIELSYKVGGEELDLVLYKESASAYILNPLLMRNSSKRLVKKFSEALGL